MPPISVIIPVLHEPAIHHFLTTLYARFPHASFEVIIVDGEPQGRSIASIKGSEVVTLVSKPGRGHQMNAGARTAKGDILLFLHADTHLPDNAFEKIRETMDSGTYTAGAFTLRFAGNKKALSLIARAATLRCRLTRTPYGDQAIFMRRGDFFRLGGYRDIAVMEDIDLMRRIRKRGERIRLLNEAVLTSARRWEQEGLIFSLVRTWILSSLFLCGVAPKRLEPYYRPNRP
ncbi:glycosyl transferase family 2 [Desulfoluna limicola]|uniref:Glycosyl transferase family 2 n=1 Tax=Desulfoluna limicola TaxID=2810562 RepID=A0ABM7PEZ8_9BACT|nr:TIGR04283 family arsenosugar biosynthesis glycosyltransferase [Desulfoluna limicola]BCS95742.1 glycosyl transferase family 2 [Desulfoluna limicola]